MGFCIAITMGFPKEIIPYWEEDDVVTFMAAAPHIDLPAVPIIDDDQAVQQHDDDPVPQDDLYDTDADSLHSDPESDSWFTIQVYSLTHPPAAGRVDWSSYDSLHRTMAEIMCLSRHELQQFFQVQVPPLDLETVNNQIFLALQHWDILPGRQQRLVLLDVQFHSSQPLRLPETVREARLLPATITRQQLFQTLGLEAYCGASSFYGCLLWWNNVLHFQQDPRPLALANGDYVRIAVPPEPTLLDAIPTRTAAALCHRGLTLGHINTRWVQDDIDSSNHTLVPLLAEEDLVTMAQLTVATRSKPNQNRIPEDPAETLRPCYEYNEAMAREAQIAWWALPAPIPLGLDALQAQLHHVAAGDITDGFRIQTWYLNHRTAWRCNIARPVQLSGDAQTWADDIATVWRDERQADMPITYHLVVPTQYDMEAGIMAHLLVVQPEEFDVMAILISMYGNAIFHGAVHRFAVLHGPILSFNDLLVHADRSVLCTFPGVQCMAWHGWDPIHPAGDLPLQNGFGVTLVVQRPTVPMYSDDVWNVPTGLTEDVWNTVEDGEAQDESSLLQSCPRRQSTSSPVPIKLDEVIPMPMMVQIPCQRVEFVRQQLMMNDLGVIWDAHQVVKWHQATQDALDCTPDWTTESPVAFTFYTDGSSQQHDGVWKGAAAVVLITHTAQGERFGGFRNFQVQELDQSPATAPRSELTAIVAALFWAVELMESQQVRCPMCFAYDSLLAGKAMNGQWSVNSHQDLVTVGRSLVHWLEVPTHLSLSWTHVPAHTGNAWNEAADAISWASLHGWIVASDLCPMLKMCTYDFTDYVPIQWLWYLELAIQGDVRVPPIVNHHLLANIAPPLLDPPDPEQHAMMQRQHVPEADDAPHRFVLRCATANVLTLHTSKQEYGQAVTARQEALLREFAARGTHVIGVQESRTRTTGYQRIDGFHVLSAAATQGGVGGIQLWIAAEWHADSRCIRIRHQDLKIVHATSQRIVVRLRAPMIKLLFVVGHAPNLKPRDVTAQWWQHTSAAIPASLQTWPLIAFLDANARVGSVISSSVGSHQSAVETEQGEAFHEWLLAEDLIVPQTFADHHSGPADTWWHASGSGARLDYVAISRSLMSGDVRTFVSDVDLTLHKCDHAPVEMHIPLMIADARDAHIPPSSLSSSDSSLLLPLSEISWNVNVHTHAAALHAQLAAKQGDVPVRFKRKRHLTEDTWNMIQWKKYHWKRWRQIGGALRTGLLRQCFQAWTGRSQTCDCFDWYRVACRQLAIHLYAYDDLCPKVVRAIRSDDQAYYQDLAFRSGEIAADEGLTGLWKQIKAILPRQIAKRKSSLRCMGPDAQEETSHYSALEAGSSCDYATLLRRCHDQQLRAGHDAPLLIDLHDIPSRLLG